MKNRLILHGGAWNIPADLHKAHINGIRETLELVQPELNKGAQAFARSRGIHESAPEALLTERELETWQRLKADPEFKTHQPFDKPMGTVGAVARDEAGNLAAATSTGGTPHKLAGRVGDTPIIGAGTYADNLQGAASATGWGESILKVMLTRKICDLFEAHPAQQAAKVVIQHLKERVNGLGGVIGIDSDGNYAFHHNTPDMAFGYIGEAGRAVVKIKV